LFNKDGLFGKKDEDQRIDPRAIQVNVTPELRGTPMRTPAGAPQPAQQTEQPQPERSITASRPVVSTPSEESTGSKLIVGPDIKLKGVEITDCDTLVVEGRVEASMDSRVVQIAQNGVFTGKATMDVAEIWGTFEGQLTVRKQLVIYSTGRVSGQIRYGTIRIEEGGELSGDVSTLGGTQTSARKSDGAANAASKVSHYEALERPAASAGKTAAAR
jgi:cytoskeletal protein CcmA (bactofilin family)